MHPAGFKCTHCGNCCRNAFKGDRVEVSCEEVELWRKYGREDILEWVETVADYGQTNYYIWVDPKTGEAVKQCPWLVCKNDESLCSIHDVKPEYGKSFPVEKEHAFSIHCQGFY